MTVKVKFVMALVIVGLLTVGIFAKENYNEKKFANQETFTIRLAHVSNETSPIHLQSLKLKELLEAESDGRFKVEIYPNGQLGGDRQATESVSLGTVTASLPGTAILSGFEPKFMVGDLPFLFTSREAAYKAYDNELGEELNKLLDPLNLVNLGYSETGFRHISNSKHPITTPEDLEGIKIRTSITWQRFSHLVPCPPQWRTTKCLQRSSREPSMLRKILFRSYHHPGFMKFRTI